jgi:hypothetical protein
LELETKQALASQDWLNVSSESVLEFLNMDWLKIDEVDLLRALIRWGKYQTQRNEVGNLRSKILPGLQKIRFCSFSQLEVAQVCEEELGEVLTAEEKYSILKSFITGDWKLMPSSVVSSSKLAPRPHGRYTFCPLLFNEIPVSNLQNITDGTWTLYFQINKKAEFIGVKINLPACLHLQVTLSSVTLHTDLNYKRIVFGTATRGYTSQYRGEEFFKSIAPQNLAADTKYSLTFFTSYTPSNGGFYYDINNHFSRTYALPKDKNQSCSDGLILTVLNAHQSFPILIQDVVFSKVLASP